MRIAALQMCSGADIGANLRVARTLLEQAARAGAELAALPEYWSAMGLHESDKLARAEAFGDGPVQQFLAQCARELGLWLVGGTLPLASDAPGRVSNTTLVHGPDGRCVARYDKIHLFRFDNGREQFDEARTIAAGAQAQRFALTARDGSRWRVGLSVCYDLRFPELYREHARAGADLLMVPSAFTHTTGQAHWDVLLRARAIENLSYVLAPAQGGQHENGRRTWGRSMAVDPWGEVLALQAEGPGVVLAELDAARLAQVRGQLPALAHRVL
ncbi:carbon-nitrogen hydrolase family protein [Melaminivora sp.]|uniref:carbon-nitrogen hydrolase family protein n=1 Tax=Melaminivora sp. TaxID=1933032 RepID=UPI0028A7BE89|nr:carbon-nitrogen hydrolase family protein [Melaminivora sp.]